MRMSRLLDLVLYGLLALLILWHGYDFFVAVRAVEYFTEKPIRIVYVVGFAVWLGTFLHLLLSRPRASNGKGRTQ